MGRRQLLRLKQTPGRCVITPPDQTSTALVMSQRDLFKKRIDFLILFPNLVYCDIEKNGDVHIVQNSGPLYSYF